MKLLQTSILTGEKEEKRKGIDKSGTCLQDRNFQILFSKVGFLTQEDVIGTRGAVKKAR